ncbi:type II secretion system F family protein [Candidatus Albibeggiatoa sp. nov. NOAA]|uniref:type II secretion system F family protein n=1 Tax=Candidatus Albibeggiatoa sp. nov. NOAA TaxID=3162724 RepID=UPI003302B3A9|nr:type II secretion system F family protein [Thiotrichaceae bacterium]
MADKKDTSVMFVWEGKDKTGKKVKGERSGKSDTIVKAMLRREGIIVTKVKKKPKALFGGGGGKPITASDIALFARQLTTMMESGVPLLQSFDIVGQGHENPTMQKLIMALKADIEAGGTLADALRKYPDQFDTLFCNLVEAGEQAGILESLLNKVATYKEKSEAIKKKIKGALSYPVSILVVASGVSAILLIFVVPVFADLFSGFGADLPALTAMVVYLSDQLKLYWLHVLVVIFAIKTAYQQANKRSKKFNEAMQRLSLKLPVFGELIRLSSIARFARTMSTMFAAGTPMVEAMDSVAGATGNIVYYDAVMKMKGDISTGTALADSMRDCGNVWPNMVVQMVQIGEESGAIDKMLAKVADYYEEEVDEMVEKISAMMEPMIMAFLGVVIGGLVLAMYLPIFKMGEVI